MAGFFGFQFRRDPKASKNNNESFAPLVQDDGAVVVAAGGAYGTYVDLEGSARTEAELVTKYREMSLVADLDNAIDEVVNEAVVSDSDEQVVKLNLDRLQVSPQVKQVFEAEFQNVLQLLEFDNQSYDIFRRWYVDGRIYYHAIVDEKAPQNGLKELRYIDPRKIRKVREIVKKTVAANNAQASSGAVTVSKTTEEYFIYNEKGFSSNLGAVASTAGATGVKISNDSIIHVTSGIMDKNNQLVLGFLHKAIKPLNQLTSLEDATLIYRISRAPSRRVFYIDVGNLPKIKAEQYLRDIMVKFKNRIVYDSTTGEIRDDRKFMTMLEDFWLPRREGGRGTEIQQLPAGETLGQLDDVKYFQQNLYRSLNIPTSRLEPNDIYAIGRSAQITRDEIKFSKFIRRLQQRFSKVFLSALEKQLILKRVILPEEWQLISNQVQIQYAEDNLYSELKDIEIQKERLAVLQMTDAYNGKYYSTEWINKHILRRTDEEIQQVTNEMTVEAQQAMQMQMQQQAALAKAQGQQPANNTAK